jgi:hypothetical protein
VVVDVVVGLVVVGVDRYIDVDDGVVVDKRYGVDISVVVCVVEDMRYGVEDDVICVVVVMRCGVEISVVRVVVCVVVDMRTGVEISVVRVVLCVVGVVLDVLCGVNPVAGLDIDVVAHGVLVAGKVAVVVAVVTVEAVVVVVENVL